MKRQALALISGFAAASAFITPTQRWSSRRRMMRMSTETLSPMTVPDEVGIFGRSVVPPSRTHNDLITTTFRSPRAHAPIPIPNPQPPPQTRRGAVRLL